MRSVMIILLEGVGGGNVKMDIPEIGMGVGVE